MLGDVIEQLRVLQRVLACHLRTSVHKPLSEVVVLVTQELSIDKAFKYFCAGNWYESILSTISFLFHSN